MNHRDAMEADRASGGRNAAWAKANRLPHVTAAHVSDVLYEWTWSYDGRSFWNATLEENGRQIELGFNDPVMWDYRKFGVLLPEPADEVLRPDDPVVERLILEHVHRMASDWKKWVDLIAIVWGKASWPA